MSPQPILANAPNLMVIPIIAMMVVIVAGMISVLTRYKRCPAGKFIVLYGKLPNNKPVMCVQGGGVFVWPLIQDYTYMSFTPMHVDTPTFEAAARRSEPLTLALHANLVIPAEPAMMETAAERLLGLDERGVLNQIRDILIGKSRRTVASLDFQQIPADPAGLETLLRDPINEELRLLGLRIVSMEVRRGPVQNSPASPCVSAGPISPTHATADTRCGGGL